MRKQYHNHAVGDDRHYWDVHKLIRALRDAEPIDVPLSEIAEIDENWWYQEPGAVPSSRTIADHIKLMHAADASYPIVLCAEGRLMDGMHRVVKALVAGQTTIKAVKFSETPPPDFINISLDDLPYPDEEI